MRIGIDISKALGPPDGIGRYTAGLLRGLIELANEGALDPHWFHLYALFEPPAEGTAEEALRRRFGSLPPSFVCEPARSPATGEVDLFHCTTHSVPIGYRGALLFTVYDLTFATLPGAHTLDNRLHCTRGLGRALARGAALSAISQSTRDTLAARLSLDPSAISVIYPAADDRFQAPTPVEAAAVRARLDLERPYLLSVGTREPRKNLSRLIEAFASLDSAVVGERLLVIAGDTGWRGDDDGPAPEELAARLGLSPPSLAQPDSTAEAPRHATQERVRFLGRVEDDDLPALYAEADLFAYPSLAEGFGLPPLEAMACGAPVLVSNRSSLPEVVGEAALQVDPESVASIGDGLHLLLKDEALRQRLREAGFDRARRFSWRASAERLVTVYERVAAQAQAAALA